MQFKNWCLTFLNVYRYLETVSNSIDKLIKELIKKTSFSNSITTYEVANKVIEYTERKKNLINLNIIVRDALKRMKPIDVKILVLYYRDGMKSVEIANLLGMAHRTFFRRKGLAVESFCRCVRSFGFDERYFEKKFSKEYWLMNVYYEMENKSVQEEQLFENKLQEYRFLKGLTMDLSKVSVGTFNTYNSLSS